jgi:hypothetical protein
MPDALELFTDRGEQSADIKRLRVLHVEMDQVVAARLAAQGELISPPQEDLF